MISHLPRRLAWLLSATGCAALALAGNEPAQSLAAQLFATGMVFLGVAMFIDVPIHRGLRWVEHECLHVGLKRPAAVLTVLGIVSISVSAALLLIGVVG